MTTIKILLSSVALVATSTVFAQSNSNTSPWFPKGEEAPGVIGKRYAEASFGVQDLTHTAHNICYTGLGANIPVVNGLDVGGGYSYGWFTSPFDQKSNYAHTVGCDAKLYQTIENGIKPFIAVGLSRTWAKQGSSTATGWGVAIGAELPYKWLAAIPSISYQDDFKKTRESMQSVSYQFEVNARITSKIGAYVSTAYVDWRNYDTANWVYGMGVRYHF